MLFYCLVGGFTIIIMFDYPRTTFSLQRMMEVSNMVRPKLRLMKVYIRNNKGNVVEGIQSILFTRNMYGQK